MGAPRQPNRGRKPSSGRPNRGGSRSGNAGRRSSGSSSGGRSGTKGQGARGGREGPNQNKSGSGKRRRDLRGAAVDLPNWVIEDLSRTTPNHRVADALEALGEASAALADGRFPKALRMAQKAKDLAPRDATVREVLALAAYRTGDWKQALRELRTYRRFSGELTHVPVEMDTLRALDRDDDVERAWGLLRDHGARPQVMKEGRVVYASYLLDHDRVAEAREVVRPGRLSDRPFDEDLRLWYVAARAAALHGEGDEARRLRNAILEHDPSFPGIDELERLIARLP